MKQNLAFALIIILLAGVIVIYSFNQQYPTYQSPDNILFANKDISNSIVEIRAAEFYPPSLTIEQGEKITWVNVDTSPHTVSSVNNSELSSIIIPPNQTYSHIFENEGTFDYHCSFRPVLTGKIIVIPKR